MELVDRTEPGNVRARIQRRPRKGCNDCCQEQTEGESSRLFGCHFGDDVARSAGVRSLAHRGTRDDRTRGLGDSARGRGRNACLEGPIGLVGRSANAIDAAVVLRGTNAVASRAASREGVARDQGPLPERSRPLAPYGLGGSRAVGRNPGRARGTCGRRQRLRLGRVR